MEKIRTLLCSDNGEIKKGMKMFKCKLANTHWTIFVAVLIITIAFVLWFLDECLCILYVFFDGKKNLAEIMTYAGATAGGLILIGNLLANQQRAKEQQKTNELTEKGHLDNRFNNAVGHLSNENSAIVLAGIHVLHQIAVKSEDYTHIVHNLFCSYLRENSERLYNENTPDKCPVIIQTLMDYLFKSYNKKESVYKDFTSDLSYITLKNYSSWDRNEKSGHKINYVVFKNCILENCDFYEETLIECDFSGGTLTECDFRRGTLTNCFFDRGTLTNCFFDRGTLTNCFFSGGTLTECYFDEGTLIRCNFTETTLINCSFITAKLNTCEFVFPLTTIEAHKFDAKLYECEIDFTILIDTELPPQIHNDEAPQA